MYYSGISTSLMLVVLGAILAFAVNLTVTGINIHAIGEQFGVPDEIKLRENGANGIVMRERLAITE